MPPRGRPPPQKKPSNIDLSCETDPETILCKEIKEMVGEWPWLWLGPAAPTTMELSWLQDLNLLLGRTLSVVDQATGSPAQLSKEVKYTLLCLANRRKHYGGKRVVTNEHLIKASHYFDIRNLVHDMNRAESDDPAKAKNGFTRHWWVDDTSDDESDATPQPSESQHGASSSTKKRKTSDGPTSTSQSGKA